MDLGDLFSYKVYGCLLAVEQSYDCKKTLKNMGEMCL